MYTPQLTYKSKVAGCGAFYDFKDFPVFIYFCTVMLLSDTMLHWNWIDQKPSSTIYIRTECSECTEESIVNHLKIIVEA